ncbi:putative RING-H2 finger protein ATL21A [Bidens hawaiensis]|uniref:putative RING-H2 finger protein ATL21A n=1 Tax=Bidens hawaiensis TaxID=980011 RepID=UPI00404A7B04
MEAYKVLFCLFFVPLQSSATSNDCSTSYCGISFIQVKFPFLLEDQQPENCGFLGFDLRCAFPSTLRINLPSSGEFSVRSIDYISQTIRIYDPFNCLPARLLTFDLSNSPFSASYFQNFTLLSCPSDVNLSGFETIGCLSNSSFSVVATDSKTFVASMTSNQTGCLITKNLLVPVDRPYDDGFTSQLDKDLTLTWSTPDCKKCEAVGSSCGYANNNTKITTCFSSFPGAPEPPGIFRIIAFAIAIPAMTASIVIACFMCTKGRRNELTTRRTTITAVAPEDTIVPPNIVGLDQETIESYPKVVLGESKRLPGHEDATCPICLAEYHVKETVRCIPECWHCFHAECIDEWLKMNGTCPVCRNSPSPVHVES